MRTVLLDLDGTLTDPETGIIASFDHAMAALGLDPVPADRRRACIGPPLAAGFAMLGVEPARIDDAIAAYREYYAPTGLFQNRVYDGVPEALATLRDHGLRLAVATSKPEPFARQVVEHFGLDPWLEHVAGATLDGRVSAKADVIGLALEALGLTAGGTRADDDGARSDVVMVGDRSHDVVGAAAHGIACIGVGWGYGAPGELEAAGAVAVVDHPQALVARILA